MKLLRRYWVPLFSLMPLFVACLSYPASALSSDLKLPYGSGDAFVVVQGYDSPPTHINKDTYAIDFSKDGCDAYGRPVVVSASGKVMIADQEGYNGGYGTEVLVENKDNVIARYAHLMAGSLSVRAGDPVSQGMPLGLVGNTGLVAGNACTFHPGAHIHFALYSKRNDGSYDPVRPEPLSGYVNIKEGDWYLSDNDEASSQDDPTFSFVLGNVSAIQNISSSRDAVLKIGEVDSVSPATSSAPIIPSSTENNTANGFRLIPQADSSSIVLLPQASSTISLGNSFSSGGGNNPVPQNQNSEGAQNGTTADSSSSSENAIMASSSSPTSSLNLGIVYPESSSSFGFYNSSTLSIDLSWHAPANATGAVVYKIFDMASSSAVISSSSVFLWEGTSTNFSYPASPDGSTRTIGIQATDASGNTSMATTSLSLPQWVSVVQGDDSFSSYPSWYEENWYDLGTGFYGTIRSMMLKGYVDNPLYFASHIRLEEFLDSGYTELNQTFLVSDDAPFTATSTNVAINNINIPLQPNKYYRLWTYQDYQNRSIILRGTNATGTADHNAYIVNVGRVEMTSTFYPYLAWTFVPNYPSLAPPAAPKFGIAFDEPNSRINLSWEPASDPDTTSSLISYAVSISTSTDHNQWAWIPVGKELSFSAPVVFGNSYTVAVRAIDDLGNISEPNIQSWEFPSGYFPLPSQLDASNIVSGSPEQFHLSRSVSLSAISLWTAFGRGYYRSSASYVALLKDVGGSPGDQIASTNSSPDVTLPTEVWYTFSNPVILEPGDYWLVPMRDPFSLANNSIFYGNSLDELYFRLQSSP
jgi:murein DD-endopeptidase MepM/ murein hydrolase activator NlpD